MTPWRYFDYRIKSKQTRNSSFMIRYKQVVYIDRSVNIDVVFNKRQSFLARIHEIKGIRGERHVG